MTNTALEGTAKTWPFGECEFCGENGEPLGRGCMAGILRIL